MTSRYLGVISLQRYLVVERYCESHQGSSTHPRPSRGGDRSGGRDGQANSSSRAGGSAPAGQR